MVNGYVTLDLASNNIYKESLGAIKSGKPIMVVDAPQVYFADTITTKTVDDDLVVEITKGGKTITITDANSVSSEGEIQPKPQTMKSITFSIGTTANININVLCGDITSVADLYNLINKDIILNCSYYDTFDNGVANRLEIIKDTSIKLYCIKQNNEIDKLCTYDTRTEIFSFMMGEVIPDNLTLVSVVEI